MFVNNFLFFIKLHININACYHSVSSVQRVANKSSPNPGSIHAQERRFPLSMLTCEDFVGNRIDYLGPDIVSCKIAIHHLL